MQLTNTSEKVALNCLSQNEWKVDLAVDSFFENMDFYTRITTIDRRRIENWFYRYAPNSDKILIEGCIQLLNDLKLEPEDRKVLILAHKLRAQTQCEFTKQEFVNGMIEMNCESKEVLFQRLVDFENDLARNTNRLRELYSFTWNYAKPSEAKTMDWETAVQYWRILLHNLVDPNLLNLWLDFVSHNGKAVTKDTWNLLLEFVTNVDPRLSNYDFDGAWPTMIDDFVVWAREQMTAQLNPQRAQLNHQ